MFWRRLLIALVMVVACAERAAADDLRKLAREKFDEARAEFSAGHLERALSLFKQTYELAPHPDILFNIGRCAEELGHFREALDAYDRYLAVNPTDRDVAARAEAIRERGTNEPMQLPETLPPAPATTPTPEVTPPPPPVVVTAPPPPRPVYKKWWLWTTVGAVVVAGVAIGLGVGLSRPSPHRTFPPLGGP